MTSLLPAHATASSPSASPRPSAILAAAGVEAPIGGGQAQAERDFSFSDFLSVINPLQHIPVVGTLYRSITGDTPSPAAKVMGGALYGGPVGLLASAFNAMIEQTTGSDLGEKAMALLTPGAGKPGSPVAPSPQYAEAPAAQSLSAASSFAETPSESIVEATGPQPPAPILASADSPPTLTSALYSRSRAAPNATGDGPVPAGRTLADYRSFSGRPLPTVDGTRTASGAPPVRLQTTGPITPERGRTPVLAAPTPSEPQASNQAASQTVNPTAPPTNGESAASGQQTHWFQAAMMKGLDRYRDGRRVETAPQLDTSL